MDLDPKKPEPGLYRDVPWDVYRAIDAANHSTLKRLDRAPAHLRYDLDHPKEPTEAMIRGSAVDAALLEPDTFLERFACQPSDEDIACADNGCDDYADASYRELQAIAGEMGIKANGKTDELRARVSGMALWLEANKEKQLIKLETWVLIQELVDAVQNGPNQTARDLLFESEGINQATLVWRDIETDLLCKGRPDRIIREYDGCPTTADFKTSVKPATEHRRGGYLMDYWCHTQAAMYRSGLNTIAGSDALYRRPVIVMVEAAPNSHHGVVCLAIDEDTMDQGDRQYRRWLNQYAECVANDHWPSYPDGLTRVSIPRWGFDPGVELHGI